ncbi:hypothetical protein [Aureimonas sp. ME7]|uniref:hypothetical protein n=1 Tax=Aureimonas sp. ME7 TaxID=2744252 RepID=UPI0015F637AE|nr:hypothetical protein [Aureimonas sp. ME7]
MLRPLTLAAVLLAAAAPMAHAQDSYDDNGGDRYERQAETDGANDDRPPPPERDVRRGDRWAQERYDDRGPRDEARADERKPDRDREARRDDDRGPRPGGWRRGGPGLHRGPPPPPPPRAGFEIRLGPGQSIRVDCGDEDIAQCVDAAKPIIDAARDLARGEPGRQVPPPPADLVKPADAPPPPAGDAPPPPAN